MEIRPLTTEFASPERSDETELKRQSKLFSSSRQAKRFANFVPDPVFVLNRNRQVIFANTAAVKLVETVGGGDPSGLRPGEVLRCENALAGMCGCGTSSFCRYCGAVKSILSGLNGIDAIEECRIDQGPAGESLLFKCYSYQLKMSQEGFVVFILRDITKETRLQILEHVFFHDIKNTLTALNGWVNLLKNADGAESAHDASDMLVQLTSEIVDEVNAQEELVRAETNQLAVSIGSVSSTALLNEAAALYRQHEMARGKQILIDPTSASIEFCSDASLLKRVLCNMTKNALEATQEGDVITLSCFGGNPGVEFRVHNPGVIPPDVRAQIFKWSFSTKGKGRGLGTYGMRLLTERYLGGKVWLVSTESEGTTFIARYPVNPTLAPAPRD